MENDWSLRDAKAHLSKLVKKVVKHLKTEI